jgi:Domain of unknown function DUF29
MVGEAAEMKRTSVVEVAGESLYDADFYRWTQSIAECLRSGRASPAELQHVAEEIADMGKRDRREVFSRMTVLVMHLMKWAAQPELREKSSWMSTIYEQRDQLNFLLADSPSLHALLRADQSMQGIYQKAAVRAAAETRLSPQDFLPPADKRDFSAVGVDVLLGDFFPDSISDLYD